MADTPAAPIRSLAMGRVEIHGKARGEQLVSSPISHTPCFWYRVEIQRESRDSKGRREWSEFGTDVNGVGFYLEDATGRVKVDPRQAELNLKQQGDLVRDTWVEGGDPYINSVAGGTAMPHFIKAKPPGTEGDAFSQALSSEEERRRVDQLRLEMQLEKRAQETTSVVGGRFRLTEYCIVPGLAYHISGTCAENPHPRDEHDRNLITKGQNEPMFRISSYNEKELERDSRNRALKMIFGGAAVSLISLAFILRSLRSF